MAESVMTIKTFLDIAQLLPAETSILIRGDHGIGKSQIVRKLARLIAANKKIGEFEFIDRRLSQLTEGDIIGLPSVKGDTTKFNPPDWYMRACNKPCFICLDELNRATTEVMQAAFQIVLDRELNGWKLHPDSIVVACVNSAAIYMVNEMDPALIDRFFVVDLRPSVADWLSWGREDGKINEQILDFISANSSWLDPPPDAEPGGKYQSRRSWEMLNTAGTMSKLLDNPEDNMLYVMTVGFLGVECASAFTAFLKSIDNRIELTDVLNNYASVKAKVKRQPQDRLVDITERYAKYVVENCDSITDEQGACLKEFMNDLPGELRISLWTKLTAKGIEKIALAKSIHKWCAESIVTGVFGVPLGQAGVGVAPNIPSFITAADAKK